MKTETREGAGFGVQGSGRAAALGVALLLAAGLLWGGTGYAATYYWEGGSGNWTNTTLWSDFDGTSSGAFQPGAADSVIIPRTGGAAGTLSLTADAPVSSITKAQRVAVTISGSGGTRVLTVGAGGITSSSDTLALTLANTLDLRLNGSQTWAWNHTGVGGYDLIVNSAVSRQAGDTANRTLVVSAPSTSDGVNLEFYGPITDGGASGTLGLWKSGIGVVYLSTNSQSGGTTVANGTLKLITTNALASGGPLTLRGGALNLSAGAVTYTHNNVRVEPGLTTLSLASGSSFNMGTIARSAGGTVRFFDISTQTFNVSNANTNGILGPWALLANGQYVTVSAGVLQSNTPTIAATVNALVDGTVNYQLEADGTLGGNRTANTIYYTNNTTRTITLATYDLTINGFSRLNTANAQKYTINSSGGRLVIGDANELVLAGPVGYDINAKIVDGSGGPGRLVFAGWSGTANNYIKLNGTNTHSGGTFFTPGFGIAGTTLAAQTLYINSGGVDATGSSLGTGTFTIGGAGGTLNGSVTLLTNNRQIWDADFTATSAGTLNMGTGGVSLGSGAELYQTRTLTVSAGTFAIGGVISNGTYTTYPVVNLTKAGAGTLELTGVSTYSGATTLSAGMLKLGTSASLASSNITVAAGATLQLNGSQSLPNSTTLYLNGTNDLASGVAERIGALYTNGTLAANGSYGSTSSGAAHKSDAFFSGTGILKVGPPDGIVLIIK